jgi:hypothetical protein
MRQAAGAAAYAASMLVCMGCPPVNRLLGGIRGLAGVLERIRSILASEGVVMNSLVAALSDSFGVDPGQVRPDSAGVEIDRFDGWHLAPNRFVVPSPITRVMRRAEQNAGA